MRKRESWDEWLKVCPCDVGWERDVDGVITIRRTAQHTDKQEVGAEGMSQPEVLLGVGRCKSQTWRVRK